MLSDIPHTSVFRHKSLTDHHFSYHLFIIICLLTARFAALEKPVISLGIKQPALVKSCLLETVIHICCQHKIIFFFYQIIQFFIHRLWRILIAIEINIPAPVCPVFFLRLIWIKSTGIHIRKSIFFSKIRKILCKPLPVIHKSRRCGKSRTRADHYCIRFFYHFFYSADFIRAAVDRVFHLPL